MNRFQYTEPFFVERIDEARACAKKLLHEIPKTEDDLFNHYKVMLCMHYNILFFDPRWETYTLGEIALEWFIIEEKSKTKDQQVSENLTTEYADDLSAIADEMEFGLPQKLEVDEDTANKMKQFMSDGKFSNEGN